MMTPATVSVLDAGSPCPKCGKWMLEKCWICAAAPVPQTRSPDTDARNEEAAADAAAVWCRQGAAIAAQDGKPELAGDWGDAAAEWQEYANRGRVQAALAHTR